MSSNQHMFVRFIAVAVLVALHWFPHTHAAPLLASTATSPVPGTSSIANQPAAERSAEAEPVGVATIP